MHFESVYSFCSIEYSKETVIYNNASNSVNRTAAGLQLDVRCAHISPVIAAAADFDDIRNVAKQGQ